MTAQCILTMALKGEVIGLQQCDGARGEGDDQLQHEGGAHTQEGGGQQGGQQHKIKDRDNMNILLGVPLEMA